MKIECTLRLQKDAFTLDVSLESSGQCIGLFGPSGAGKTTLIRALAGLEPARGRVAIDEATWQDTSIGESMSTESRRIGWVPQQGAVFPHRSVQENLHFSPRAESHRFAEVVSALDLDTLLTRPATSLSGGEQRRVALGRALMSSPCILLLDEPMSGLDWQRKHDFIKYLFRLQERFDVPAIMVSHDPVEVGLLCDTVWLMQAGSIQGTGTPEDVFLKPGSEKAAYITGIENIWHGKVVSVANGWAQVDVGGLNLAAEYDGGAGDRVTVALAAAEVLLSRTLPSGTSARNVWLARVTDVRQGGREVSIHMGCAEPGTQNPNNEMVPLLAIITPAARDDLELKKGDVVYALFKASATSVFGA